MSATLDEVKNQTFDYIVVGGGAAGLTVAARLTEDENISVCVLEAGDANLNDPVIMRTGGYGVHLGNKTYDWIHETKKNKLLDDKALVFNRGRCLGGSTAINFMMYTKPPAEEIDDFERLGNPGWNWKNLQKYMNKAEGFIDGLPDVMQQMNIKEVKGIGRDGPLTVTFPRTCSDLFVRARDAMHNAGFPLAKRPYDGDPRGVYAAVSTLDTRTNTRAYAVTAYYLPNKDRKNLNVLVNARAHRIITGPAADGLFNAKGVEFEYGGQTHVVHARKEVILSAGTLRSPPILELSGFGRRDVLDKAGVALKKELPGVGENMQEHIISCLSYEFKDDYDVLTFDVLRDPKRLAEEIELYDKNKPSLLTIGLITIAFVSVEKITPKALSIFQNAKKVIDDLDAEGALPPGLKEQYDIQLHRLQPGMGSTPQCEYLCFPGFLSAPNPPVEGKRYITLAPASNSLFSRGTIHITSSDPTKEPEIDPHYFERDVDLQVHLEMVKYMRKLTETSPLKEVIAREVNPGPEVQTDHELEAWIKTYFLTPWHTGSTCSMLPEDKGGVVDHNLKVYGTSNLRVVDLSVVPLHFSAHSQAVVYGLAEQAADIIRGRFVSQ